MGGCCHKSVAEDKDEVIYDELKRRKAVPEKQDKDKDKTKDKDEKPTKIKQKDQKNVDKKSSEKNPSTRLYVVKNRYAVASPTQENNGEEVEEDDANEKDDTKPTRRRKNEDDEDDDEKDKCAPSGAHDDAVQLFDKYKTRAATANLSAANSKPPSSALLEKVPADGRQRLVAIQTGIRPHIVVSRGEEVLSRPKLLSNDENDLGGPTPQPSRNNNIMSNAKIGLSPRTGKSSLIGMTPVAQSEVSEREDIDDTEITTQEQKSHLDKDKDNRATVEEMSVNTLQQKGDIRKNSKGNDERLGGVLDNLGAKGARSAWNTNTTISIASSSSSSSSNSSRAVPAPRVGTKTTRLDSEQFSSSLPGAIDDSEDQAVARTHTHLRIGENDRSEEDADDFDVIPNF